MRTIVTLPIQDLEPTGTAGAMLKSVSLELGGKSPVIVFADADVRRAARAVALSGFNTKGRPAPPARAYTSNARRSSPS